jgi:16S rRNA U516 pseudouridylate synthase RsuA-like enzyme
VPLERRHQAPSIVTLLEDYFRSSGKRKPFVVHRIDLDTSGLVLFAKTALAQQRLKDQFRRREPERVYWAVVYGHPDPPQGTWRDRLVWDTKALIQKQTHPSDPGGTDAECNYKVLEPLADTTLIEVRLHTGKRNQIRIQARLRGHTLVGEKRYVFGPDALRPIAFPRQALHARRLAFRHPSDDRPLEFEAPYRQTWPNFSSGCGSEELSRPQGYNFPPMPTCLNCGATLAGRFCADCGQRDVPPRPTVRELAGDAYGELVGWDGRLARTLALLLRSPGTLIREILDGRRSAYISPVRLYLACSLLYFLGGVGGPRARHRPQLRCLVSA